MDSLLGAVFPLVLNAASFALPLLANGLIQVKPPPRVNIPQARQEAMRVRPIVPYGTRTPYTGGRVRGLFIGINYRGTSSQLSGCVNDVGQIIDALQRIQFPISECCILVDDPRFPNFTDYPTRANMIKYMAWLTNDVRPGDVLFFHYSGHGAQSKSQGDSEEEYDQSLVPLDYEAQGSILDDDLYLLLVQPLPAGVRMTCVLDCCHSATMLDLPFSFVPVQSMDPRRQGYTMQVVRRNNFSNGDVVVFSGCADEGTSADVSSSSATRVAGGAATQAFTWTLLNTTGLNYIDIFLKTRSILRSRGFKQVAQLTSSKPVDLYKPFSLFGTITVDQHVMQNMPPQFHTLRQQQAHPIQYPAMAKPPPNGPPLNQMPYNSPTPGPSFPFQPL